MFHQYHIEELHRKSCQEAEKSNQATIWPKKDKTPFSRT